MSFANKLTAARTIVLGRAAARGVTSGAGRYASVSVFNQNDEGIWKNGTGDGHKPDRNDGLMHQRAMAELFTPHVW